ncbi:phage minor tail protein L [Pseudomonas sp. 25 R 14]|uniref:phage minor tail protein L n=1 Tax=Pseudomonas sp. 25 R 14 TaxID=1844109 RepID=UPI001EFBDE15|nr:phage minor tail protein L [Pseudomonas sp. 25 R 14]
MIDTGAHVIELLDHVPAKSIWFQGNEYGAWPMHIEGIEANGDGTAVRPSLAVGNVNGRITALCLAFDDLLEFKLTMRHTLGRFVDAENFEDGNPEADPTQESIEVWYIDQKTSEDGETVGWALASPGDVGGESIGRQMTTLCHWALTGGYRGPSCGWTGGYFDMDGNPTDDPERDQCNALLTTGCRCRFGENNPLPFGGMPAVSLIARS